MINKGTAYIRVRDAEQINQVVRMIQQEICAYLDWAACPRVSLLAKERAVKLLREVKRTAEEAFESQDGSYAEVVLGRGHGGYSYFNTKEAAEAIWKSARDREETRNGYQS